MPKKYPHVHRCESGYWSQKYKPMIKISDMDDEYLNNSINIIENYYSERKELYQELIHERNIRKYKPTINELSDIFIKINIFINTSLIGIIVDYIDNSFVINRELQLLKRYYQLANIKYTF